MGAKQIRSPFGEADVIALTATGAQAITPLSGLTIIDGVTVSATGNRTLNVTLDDGLLKGDRLVIKAKTDGTETTIFGTNITGITITGAAGKTKVTEFVFDGTAFINTGTPVQID